MTEKLSHDMQSFVSYALAMGPAATVHNHKTNELIEFRFDERRKLGDREIASLQTPSGLLAFNMNVYVPSLMLPKLADVFSVTGLHSSL